MGIILYNRNNFKGKVFYMKKAKFIRYTAHLEYDVDLDLELLNMKIRIIDENFETTGTVFYNGTVHKFIKERIPSPTIVELLPKLKVASSIPYKFHGGVNYIQRVL
jgi:hypothetical protein